MTSNDVGFSRCQEKVAEVDPFFNFHLVVFKVGATLFQVVRNIFEVPGTIFEAMFALPPGDKSTIEGTSLDNPITPDGIAEEHFRAFLRALYPFAGQPPVTSFEDWLGVLQLATMWEFKLLRETAMTALSDVVAKKDVKEQSYLGVTYRVVSWVREGYITLVRSQKIDHKELGKMPFALGWETIACIFAARDTIYNENYRCCGKGYGIGKSKRHCRCRALVAVNGEFREELEGFEEFTALPAPHASHNHIVMMPPAFKLKAYTQPRPSF